MLDIKNEYGLDLSLAYPTGEEEGIYSFKLVLPVSAAPRRRGVSILCGRGIGDGKLFLPTLFCSWFPFKSIKTTFVLASFSSFL